jgi:hypothetical protein
MKRCIAILGLGLLTTTAGWAAPSSATQAAETAAVQSAEAWLVKVDAGKYHESWDDAAEVFRSAVRKDQWPQMLTSVRKPLGKVGSRKVLSKKYTESLPNAPAGKYVILQFETAFENKKAIETVTPMLDKDGKWRVSGYFIKE